jgi:uncharacterized protein
MTLAVLGLAASLVGFLIGTVGVGGVLLAPALILVGRVEPHRATAVSLISFTFAGVISAAMYWRGNDFPGALIRALAIGLLPGAFLGGWLSSRIPDVVILAALSAISLFSALWIVAGPAARTAERGGLATASAAPLGLGIGFGSAVTGTSGPVLLTPTLMALNFPTRRAIAVGQIIQIFVTPAGSFGYLVRSRPDLPLTAVLATATAVGTGVGIYASRRLRLSESFLRVLVIALLIATGALVAVKLAGRL